MRYPLFLDLTDQPVAVIGAGAVAVRKIRTLLAAGARITVISPLATKAIRQLARKKQLGWRRRAYRPGDLRGARLVIAATNAEAVNRQVCTEARRRRQWVNCVAPPAAGNFIVPALVQRGRLTVAISTGGSSPALAKQLRRDLERFFGAGYARLTRTMGALRHEVAAAVGSQRQRTEIYRQAVRRWGSGKAGAPSETKRRQTNSRRRSPAKLS